jgi:hypothetical protein
MTRSKFLFDRSVHPFGKSWEEWAAVWYRWMISIPKDINPCVDQTGHQCSINQYNENVWFLAGTFGNEMTVTRNCRIPFKRAILFPILVKEDSFIEDSDLNSETELRNRAKEATDMITSIKLSIDGQQLLNVERPINEEAQKKLRSFRVHSDVINLVFPEQNVYDVAPGPSRSVSDGFWLFAKPFDRGEHSIHFQGETKLIEKYTFNRMMKAEVYSQIRGWMIDKKSFKVDVLYKLLVTEHP